MCVSQIQFENIIMTFVRCTNGISKEWRRRRRENRMKIKIIAIENVSHILITAASKLKLSANDPTFDILQPPTTPLPRYRLKVPQAP